MSRITRRALLASAAGLLLAPAALWADEPKVDVQETIRKGLEWLAKNQNKTEGHWEANGGQYPTTMTALAGMALLMEGSTLREGKYADNLRKAVDWLMKRAPAERPDRQPEQPDRGRPLHVRPRLRPAVPRLRLRRGRGRRRAARSWRRC